jgi:hypothetical protein
MAVTENKAIYSARGRDFEDKKEAEAWDNLANAHEDYTQALYVLSRRVAETQRTADGFLFDLSRWSYYVISYWHGMPNLCKVDFYRDFRLDYASGDVEVGHNRNGDMVWFRVRDLYREKDNAERSVLVERDKWIAEEQATSDEMRARLGAEA